MSKTHVFNPFDLLVAGVIVYDHKVGFEGAKQLVSAQNVQDYMRCCREALTLMQAGLESELCDQKRERFLLVVAAWYMTTLPQDNRHFEACHTEVSDQNVLRIIMRYISFYLPIWWKELDRAENGK